VESIFLVSRAPNKMILGMWNLQKLLRACLVVEPPTGWVAQPNLCSGIISLDHVATAQKSVTHKTFKWVLFSTKQLWPSAFV